MTKNDQMCKALLSAYTLFHKIDFPEIGLRKFKLNNRRQKRRSYLECRCL